MQPLDTQRFELEKAGVVRGRSNVIGRESISPPLLGKPNKFDSSIARDNET